MNTDFRSRILLPIVLPLAVLAGIVVVVGLLAAILLYTPRVVGLTIAMVVAAGFMVAFSLANAVDEEMMTLGRRVVIGAVAILPVLGGGGAALWTVNGGVAEEDLASSVPAYYEPVQLAPEGALVGAKNEQSFCVFEDPDDQSEAGCTDVSEVTFPAQPDSAEFAYVFNNLQSGVPHNFQIFELTEDGGEPAPGEIVFGVDDGASIVTGQSITYAAEQGDPPIYEEGAQFYYNCVVHPPMQGVLTIGPPPEGAEA